MENNFSYDKNRDAYATINGFVYQVNLSIYEWITISDNEYLALEAGEDIDKIILDIQNDTLVRELGQAKYRGNNITINTNSFLESIFNFYNHKKENPSIKLIFRFITNAEFGLEKNPSFKNTPALSIWVDSQTKKFGEVKENIDTLKNIILKSTKPDKLKEDNWNNWKERLKKMSLVEWHNFIKDFKFAQDSKNNEDLKQTIINCLASYSSPNAEKLYYFLFAFVFNHLTQKERDILNKKELDKKIENELSSLSKAGISSLNEEILLLRNQVFNQLIRIENKQNLALEKIDGLDRKLDKLDEKFELVLSASPQKNKKEPLYITEAEPIFDISLSNRKLTEVIFPLLQQGDVILILGPSIILDETSPFLMDKIIEKYMNDKNIPAFNYGSNIQKFVDILFSDSNYRRPDFNKYITNYISKLPIPVVYQRLKNINWKQIITTNFDTLLEQSFDINSESGKKFKIVFDERERGYETSSKEIKLIKLNGCASRMDEYPYRISEKDLDKVKKYYKKVFNDLGNNVSTSILILAIGFSDGDKSAQYLFEMIEKINYRNGKSIYLIDSQIDDMKNRFYKSQNIAVIKGTSLDFFDTYLEWLKTSPLRTERSYVHKKGTPINITKYLNNLKNTIVPFDRDKTKSDENNKEAQHFFTGEEPTFDIIIKNYDVIRHKKLNETKNIIVSKMDNQENEVTIFLLSGSYGCGKSTFTYRLIYQLISLESKYFIAFEAKDIDKINSNSLSELDKLFSLLEGEYIILFVDGIEQDSVFKNVFKLQNLLQTDERFLNYKITIIASIRENILEKLNNDLYTSKFTTIEIGTPFSTGEAKELINKLENYNLLEIADNYEKEKLITKICNDYEGNILVALLSLINGVGHGRIIKHAYEQLNETPDLQISFKFISLLYRYNITMPASLLRNLVNKDWGDFTNDIIKKDGKGIIIQDISKTAQGSEPDLYFKTKHPIISDSLIKSIYKKEENKWDDYKKIFRVIKENYANSRMVIDLLKALKNNKEFDDGRINDLFDLCEGEFCENEHYVLHYAMNLQLRNGILNLKKAERIIIDVESRRRDLFKRNDRLIHRRAFICYDLAKSYLDASNYRDAVHYYGEAQELFEYKKRLDPYSSFSYIEYIKMSIWAIKNNLVSESEQIEKKIIIEELFDEAENVTIGDIEKIKVLEIEYQREFHVSDTDSYLNKLEIYYENDIINRPYHLANKYFYYIKKNNLEAVDACIEELELYSNKAIIARILFKHYGRNLHKNSFRTKFSDLLSRNHTMLAKDELRYHFFKSISHAYDKSFSYAKDELREIRKIFGNRLNHKDYQYWREENGENTIHKGRTMEIYGKKMIKVISLQKIFPVENWKSSHVLDSMYQVNLKFSTSGIIASILEDK